MTSSGKEDITQNMHAPQLATEHASTSQYFQLYQGLFMQLLDNLRKEFWDCNKTMTPIISAQGQGQWTEVHLSDDQVLRLIHLQKFVPLDIWESECTQIALAQAIADFLSATQGHTHNCLQWILPGSKFLDHATSYEHSISPFQADQTQLFRMGLIAYAHGAFKLVLPPIVSSKLEYYFGSTVIIDRN